MEFSLRQTFKRLNILFKLWANLLPYSVSLYLFKLWAHLLQYSVCYLFPKLDQIFSKYWSISTNVFQFIFQLYFLAFSLIWNIWGATVFFILAPQKNEKLNWPRNLTWIINLTLLYWHNPSNEQPNATQHSMWQCFTSILILEDTTSPYYFSVD